MTTGDRERYEQLADPAMYWTQTNGEPVREPIAIPSKQDGDSPAPPDGPDGGPATAVVGAQTPFPAESDDHRYSRSSFYDRSRADEEVDPETRRYDRFGGVNWGAGFFGWIVTVGVTALLGALSGVLIMVLDRTVDAVSTTLDNDPRTVGLVAVAVAASVLLVGSYSGGYVAGRMSRYDGGKQGAAVWVTGVMLTALGAGLVLVFGSEYNVLDRFDLPSVTVPEQVFGVVGLVAVVVAAFASLLASIGGGKVGCRYHLKVDDYI